MYSSYDEDAMTEGNLGRRTCKGGVAEHYGASNDFFCSRSEDEGSKAKSGEAEKSSSMGSRRLGGANLVASWRLRTGSAVSKGRKKQAVETQKKIAKGECP